MALVIGPHFADELTAAGLWGLQVAWGSDGQIHYGPTVTEAQKAAVSAVLAAHNPTTPGTDAVRNAYVDAKAAMTAFAADSTLATAKPALIKLGLCVEELLKFLNRRIS